MQIEQLRREKELACELVFFLSFSFFFFFLGNATGRLRNRNLGIRFEDAVLSSVGFATVKGTMR